MPNELAMGCRKLLFNVHMEQVAVVRFEDHRAELKKQNNWCEKLPLAKAEKKFKTYGVRSREHMRRILETSVLIVETFPLDTSMFFCNSERAFLVPTSWFS